MNGITIKWILKDNQTKMGWSYLSKFVLGTIRRGMF